MKWNKKHWLLILLFLFVLGLRLYFSLSVPQFATDESYFGLNVIQNFLNEGSIGLYDEFSYGGRALVFSPLFYLVFGIFSFGSTIAMKVISEILFSSLVFIVFALAYRYTANFYIAFMSTIFANFVPIFMAGTINTITPYAFAIPLIFLMLFSLMNLDSRFYRGLFLVSAVLLPLIHGSAFLFLVTILLFFFLLQGGAVMPTKRKKEILFAGFFAILLVGLIVYKRALMKYGLGLLWQNLPLFVFADAFRSLSVFSLIFAIGLVPLILGLIGLYFGVIKEKSRHVYLLSSFMLGVLFLLLFQLIPFSEGLIFLGLSLGILSAISLNRIWIYSKGIKWGIFGNVLKFILPIILILFVIIGTIGFVSNTEPVDAEIIKDLEYLSGSNVDVIAAGVYEGHLITAIAKKKNVADTNFLLAPSAQERVEDLNLLYKTNSKAVAYDIIKKYNVGAILLSEETKVFYQIEELGYAIENECFEKKGNLYLVKCTN